MLKQNLIINYFSKFLLTLLLLNIASTQPAISKELLSAKEFSIQYLKLVKKHNPKLKIKRLDDLGFKITTQKNREVKAFLDNAYREYKNSPNQMNEILQRHVDTVVTSLNPIKLTTKREQIVPLIRSIDYINQIEKLTKDAKEKSALIYESFVPGLVILYAIDSPKTIRGMVSSDLKDLKIQKKEVSKIALTNLNKLMNNKIKRYGKDGLYAIELDGTYESSLLLSDEIWNNKNFPVKGEFIVFIPSRDQIIITGSNDKKLLGEAMRFAKQAYQKAARPLFSKALVRRNGKWQLFSN